MRTAMRTSTRVAGLLLVPLGLLTSGPAAQAMAVDRGAGPFAIPTFHCLGIYWSPAGGVASREVQVRYRRQGATK
jgi:hypothetical protein